MAYRGFDERGQLLWIQTWTDQIEEDVGLMRERRIGVNQLSELSRQENELIGGEKVQSRKVVSELENVIWPIIEGWLKKIKIIKELE